LAAAVAFFHLIEAIVKFSFWGICGTLELMRRMNSVYK
jgi:hypothetical protein